MCCVIAAAAATMYHIHECFFDFANWTMKNYILCIYMEMCIYICFNIVMINITIRKKQVAKAITDRQNIYMKKKKYINDNNKKEGRLNVCIYSHLFSFLSYYDDSHT